MLLITAANKIVMQACYKVDVIIMPASIFISYVKMHLNIMIALNNNKNATYGNKKTKQN